MKKLNLIEGNFSYEEAKEILMNVFSTKIHFHEIKNFSSKERIGTPDETAKKRILELKNEIEKLQKILSEAKLKNKRLLVSSQINISILED